MIVKFSVKGNQQINQKSMWTFNETSKNKCCLGIKRGNLTRTLIKGGKSPLPYQIPWKEISNGENPDPESPDFLIAFDQNTKQMVINSLIIDISINDFLLLINTNKCYYVNDHFFVYLFLSLLFKIRTNLYTYQTSQLSIDFFHSFLC